MTIRDIDTLKSYFQKGYPTTQVNYEDMIETLYAAGNGGGSAVFIPAMRGVNSTDNVYVDWGGDYTILGFGGVQMINGKVVSVGGGGYVVPTGVTSIVLSAYIYFITTIITGNAYLFMTAYLRRGDQYTTLNYPDGYQAIARSAGRTQKILSFTLSSLEAGDHIHMGLIRNATSVNDTFEGNIMCLGFYAE